MKILDIDIKDGENFMIVSYIVVTNKKNKKQKNYSLHMKKGRVENTVSYTLENHNKKTTKTCTNVPITNLCEQSPSKKVIILGGYSSDIRTNTFWKELK